MGQVGEGGIFPATHKGVCEHWEGLQNLPFGEMRFFFFFFEFIIPCCFLNQSLVDFVQG